MASDVELLEAWRAGDRVAGNELASRHMRALYGCFRNKVEGACDDLIQRTFLRCVESVNRFRGDSSFRTYLFAIARNELYQHYRRRGRERARLDFRTVSVQDLCASPTALFEGGPASPTSCSCAPRRVSAPPRLNFTRRPHDVSARGWSAAPSPAGSSPARTRGSGSWGSRRPRRSRARSCRCRSTSDA